MYQNYKVVVNTAAGRRRYMQYLVPPILNADIVDRYDIWVNTRNMVDIEFFKKLAQKYPKVNLVWQPDGVVNGIASIIMSAETMVVVEDLYAKYPDIDALANATPEEIEEIVRPCGLGKSKARDINACMRMLRDEYHSQVPDDFNALLKLPGVGRKSANLIMGDVFKKPAIVTDTHCIRLCNRIGLVHDCKDPKKVEMALWKIVPPEEGSSLCHRFVEHGREVCTARTTPHCERCVLADICEKNGVEK